MALLMKTVGPKHTIMVGLFFEMLQLMWYGFGSQPWMMWSAGVLASVSSITYPAISAFVSMHADADKQVSFIGIFLLIFTGLRIRIHFIRIRIQHFRLNTDPDPIRIQAFNDQKFKKIYS
jgi:hypothetical protein